VRRRLRPRLPLGFLLGRGRGRHFGLSTFPCASSPPPAALRTKPMSCCDHPRSPRNTATNGPKPAKTAAMKRLTPSRARRLRVFGGVFVMSQSTLYRRPLSECGTLLLEKLISDPRHAPKRTQCMPDLFDFAPDKDKFCEGLEPKFHQNFPN
jgi:hypothetical protein